MEHVLGLLGIPQIPDHKAFCRCCNVIVSAKTFDHHLLAGKHKRNAEIFIANNELFKKEYVNPEFPVLSQKATDPYLYRKIIITKLLSENNDIDTKAKLKIGGEYNVCPPPRYCFNDEFGVYITIVSGTNPIKILTGEFEFLF
jgi:hypothetical protein